MDVYLTRKSRGNLDGYDQDDQRCLILTSLDTWLKDKVGGGRPVDIKCALK